MKLKTFRTKAPTYRRLQHLAMVIQTADRDTIAATIAAAASDPLLSGKTMQAMLAKLATLVATNAPQYEIFRQGNGKLPFLAFSTLPAVTCNGAGDCLNFCYSFQAWRFAHAFGRMAQNAYLMRFNPESILAELDQKVSALAEKTKGAPVDLRINVDGDFSSVADVSFWFGALLARPWIAAYGYSKSYAEILAYRGDYPTNYRLNLSSGHCHDAATVAAVAALPIVRGEFIAVDIGYKATGAAWGTKALSDATRAAAKRQGHSKAFACPGRCGACTTKGHACGSNSFRGIVIAIPFH